MSTWIVARPVATVLLVTPVFGLSAFGFWLLPRATGEPAAIAIFAAVTIFLAVVGIVVLLRSSVFVREGAVRPGIGRGWSPVAVPAELLLLDGPYGSVILVARTNARDRPLLMARSVLGLTNTRAIRAALEKTRERIFKAADIDLPATDA